MYTIKIEANNDDSMDTFATDMAFTFPEQPTWHELTDKFLDFLKSQGYVFSMYAVLTVNDNDGESNEEEPVHDYGLDSEEEAEHIKAKQGNKKGRK